MSLFIWFACAFTSFLLLFCLHIIAHILYFWLRRKRWLCHFNVIACHAIIQSCALSSNDATAHIALHHLSNPKSSSYLSILFFTEERKVGTLQETSPQQKLTYFPSFVIFNPFFPFKSSTPFYRVLRRLAWLVCNNSTCFKF